MRLTVCFEAGRFTLTQSSWTALSQRCSRKWMSGYASTLAARSDRGQVGKTNKALNALRESTFPPSAGKSPFSLDFYLSWMSPVFGSNCLRASRVAFIAAIFSLWEKVTWENRQNLKCGCLGRN
jgi:hypothetical protein